MKHEIAKLNKKKKKTKMKKQYEVKIIEKSLFKYDYYENSLLFYRINYAWYITIFSEYNNISKYRLKDLKKLDWSPIIPNSNELDDNIDSKIKEREYILNYMVKINQIKIFINILIE